MTLLPQFDLIRVATLAEMAAARRAHPESRLLAGGTDLIANLRRGIGEPPALIDITGLPELHEMVLERGNLRIGAGVTLARLAEDAVIRRHLPALAAAAATVAGPTHRATATLGGNLCLDTRCVFYNESEWWRRSNDFCLKHRGTVCHVAPTGKRCHAAYSGDTAPALLALGASAEIGGDAGTRVIRLDQLFAEDGAAHLTLGAGEILLGVRVPLAPALKSGYEKGRFRGAIDFPLAGVAVALARSGGDVAQLHIGLTGTNSRPLLVAGLDKLVARPLDERALQEINKLVQKQVSPMRTTIAPAHYRRRVAAALACRLASRLFAEAA